MTTLRDVLRLTYANLQILREREAGHGGSAPLSLLNQINDHRRAIELLEAAIEANPDADELARLKAQLRPLLIAANVEAIDLESLQPEIPPLPFEPETVPVAGGEFVMGSNAGAVEESPAHRVEVAAFRIGKYPVTNAQYAEFIRQNPRQDAPKRAGWFVRQPPRHKLEHPVVGVSWFDAQAYCRWLSEQTGRPYRLPTEAEWEKAAAWDGERARRYPWGDEILADRCNVAESGLNKTTAVGHYSPGGDSPVGAADMLGNVQEWVSTLWGSDATQTDFPYPYRAGDGRENARAGQQPYQRVYRLYRGGSFRDSLADVRNTARGWSDPDSKLRWRGFRVAMG